MMEDGTSLRIGDRVRLRPGSSLPSSQVPHDTVTTFVVAHIDRSREADSDVLVTIRAVTGAGPSLTVPSEALQRAVRQMPQPDAKRPAEDATSLQPLVILLEQVVARLDSQQAILIEIRDALRHQGEGEASPGHTVRY